MVGKFDILIFGGLGLFLISQKDKIASGIGGAGGFFGKAFADAGNQFFSAFDIFGQPSILDPNQPPFTVNPENASEGLLTDTERIDCQCGTSIKQDSNGVVIEKCLVCDNGSGMNEPDCGPGTFFNPISGQCEAIPQIDIPNIVIDVPEVNAEELPPMQGPINLPNEIPNIEGDNIVLKNNMNESNMEVKLMMNGSVINELPNENKNKIFGSGGLSFIGGTVRENPVDSFNEVNALFPELSASQIADFLNEFKGISPSDALRINPDIINKVANINGENITVDNVSISNLKTEENKASCTTCRLFGLNCEKCQIERLQNA